MPRVKAVGTSTDPELKGWEGVELTIAQILQERCGIPGCIPRIHLEESRIILKKLIQYEIIKERD